MDKETLSNYGWIVVLILVLSVLIALATPFGQYVKAGAENTLFGLIDTSNNAMGIVASDNSDGNHKETDDNNADLVAPVLIEGNGQTYQQKVSAKLSFRSSGDIDTFQEIKIDGAIVDPSNYEITEGSTIVTFSESYANALSKGEHTIEVIHATGIADGTFNTVSTIVFLLSTESGVWNCEEYIAIEGMTWKEWGVSEYNTSGFTYDYDSDLFVDETGVQYRVYTNPLGTGFRSETDHKEEIISKETYQYCFYARDEQNR